MVACQCSDNGSLITIMSDLPDRAGDLLHAGGDQPGPRLASHGPLPTRLRHHHRHCARSRRRVHRSEVTTLADKLYYYEVPCCAAGAGQEASPGDLVLVGVFTTESSSPSELLLFSIAAVAGARCSLYIFYILRSFYPTSGMT